MKPLYKKLIHSLLDKADITINGNDPWDMQIHDQTIYKDIVLKGSLGLGDGYIKQKWDVDKIDVFFEKILKARVSFLPSLTGALYEVQDSLSNAQVGKKAFEVGTYHYDLGNELYELMLGESMAYSSARFLDKKNSLTQAQYNKFDQLCKKLELKPGMKILEIGSGWGTFAKFAMSQYGVSVVGLTVSKEQKAYAEKACKGLPAQFILMDYQHIPNKYNGIFDRVVSIEMIEAVGSKNLKTYFSTIAKTLKPDGKFGMQVILGSGEDDIFISKRIFPNGHVPSAKEIINNSFAFLHVQHWDSFGKDYEKTLLHWEKNFKNNWNDIKRIKDTSGDKIYDKDFYRMWRYYLLLCAAGFRVGYIDVAQIVMTKDFI